MDKKEVAVLFLSSAVIGALFSSLITALAQWRERVDRERELVLKVSVELTSAYIERITGISKRLGILPECQMLPLMHEMVQQLFEAGAVSDENQHRLKGLAKIFRDESQRVE